jgi:hypothetical protein
MNDRAVTDPDAFRAEKPEEGLASRRLASFNEHRNLLFSIAYRMLGSVADAEDVRPPAGGKTTIAATAWTRGSCRDTHRPNGLRACAGTALTRILPKWL